jgi:hypothetical protein
MKVVVKVALSREPVGAGTSLQAVIHAGVDALPLREDLKARIKSCAGCGRRVLWLDKRLPNINPLAKKPAPPPRG